MKVILTQDVAKLGRRSAIVEVADGRGMNQLIPKGLALAATPENIKKLQAKNAHQTQMDTDAAAKFAAAVAALGDTPVSVSVNANEGGHLFEAVKVAAVVEALNTQGIEVSEQQIEIGTPIKSVGDHDIVLHHQDVRADVVLQVIAK